MRTVVVLPYDPLWPAVEWAEEHCPSYIFNTLRPDYHGDYNQGTKVNYYFGDEKDAVLFALRWA